MTTARKEMVTPAQEPRNASELFIKALENEGVEVIYGVPGEENLDFLEALRKSSIQLILTRHGSTFSSSDSKSALETRSERCRSQFKSVASNSLLFSPVNFSSSVMKLRSPSFSDERGNW